MNGHVESQLRSHLSSVDDETVMDPGAVASAARRATARLRTRRRVAVGVTSAVLALTAGGVVLATRPTRDDSVASQSSAPTPSTAESVPGSAPDERPGTTAPPPAASPVTLSRPIAPDPRGPSYDPAVVWTGTEAIVLGGSDPNGGIVAGVSAYDPAADAWRPLPVPDGSSNRVDPLLAWTGSEVLVVGGRDEDDNQIGRVDALDPATSTWRTVVETGPAITAASPWAWTGDLLLVWPSDSASPIALDPAATDPMTSWRVLATTPVARRQHAASVWSGSEWIVWGGTDGSREFADGAAYSPATDTWRMLAASPLGERRVRAVWTGTEMLVVAGSRGGDRDTGNGEFALGDGAAYDPATDTWRSLASGPAHPGFVPVWTGTRVLVFAKGGVHVYDAAADEWLDCCDSSVFDVPGATPLWTGEAVLAFGGTDPGRGGVVVDPDL